MLSVSQHAKYADLNLRATRTLQPIISASRRCPRCLWLGVLGTPDGGFRNCYNTSLPFLRGAWVCISNFHFVLFQCLRWEKLSSKVAFLYIKSASFVCVRVRCYTKLHYISQITCLALLRQSATQVSVSETDLPSSPEAVSSCPSRPLGFRRPVCEALK